MAAADIDLQRKLPWSALGARALYLDVDGTLLDIAPTPDSVEVPAGLIDSLAAVAKRLDGALALVSGRPIGALDQLFRPLRVAAVGIHGAEVRTAGGPVRTADYLSRQLDGVRNALAETITQWPGAVLEDKGIALALHYRASKVDARVIGRALQNMADLAGPEFILMQGKQVFEIKAAALTKASGIAALHGTKPFAGRVPVCIGDDVTDESAFGYANDNRGLSIHVGHSPTTLAQFRVTAPAEVRAWIAGLATNGESPS